MKLSRLGTVVAGIIVLAGIAPAAASAASVAIPSNQVLPPGGTACASVAVQGITPYIYNGNLHSFDVTVADPSYVSIQGQVGNTVIPFNQMSRWVNPDGSVRIHVDIQTTSIHGSLPISLTLISSRPGQPTCLSTISFSIEEKTMTPTTPTAPSTPSAPSVPSAPSMPAAPHRPSAPAVSHPSTGQGSTTATSSTSTPVGVSPVVRSSMQTNLEKACAASGALQLWFVLLALFVVIVTLTALAQPPLADRSPALPLSIILVPLVLLIAFWYLAPLCRAAGWVPAILIVASIIGLVAAFWGRNGVANVIQLPPAQPKKD